jgi:prevent-host-death family protein
MSKISHRGSEDARKELPSLIEAAESGSATIITRHGRPVAALVSVDAYRRCHRQQSLLPLEGSGHGQWGTDSTRAIDKLRGEWDR